MNMRELSPAQIWNICGKTLHNEKYCKIYVKILSDLIGDRKKTILDTACGTGFPSVDLLKKGVDRITCLDADRDEISILKSKLKSEKISIDVIEGTWQNINKIIKGKFDVLINIDSALGYMDSWNGEPSARGDGFLRE